MSTYTPSADAQVEFLDRIQGLIESSPLTTTYPPALLLAIADHCVSHDQLQIPTRELAEHVIDFYWRQAAPYAGEVLSQGRGRQARVVELVAERRTELTTLAVLKRQTTEHATLVGEVAKVLADPLKQLAQLPSCPFTRVRGGIELGEVERYCFRRYHGLLSESLRGIWIRWIRRCEPNRKLLHGGPDLHGFLFGSERADLRGYRDALARVDGTTCFYCDKKAAAADRFLPWARYPHDHGHNFVLACASCNSSKGDHLAGFGHLEAWLRRNESKALELEAAFEAAALPYDLEVSVRVAQWAYTSALGLVWEHGKLVELDPEWAELFTEWLPSAT